MKIHDSGLNTLIVLLGPTASGKTAAAIDLAEGLGTAIVSADSRQFYKEMAIGTARPSTEQLSRVRHHFIGHLSVTDIYNVSRFEQDALDILQKIFAETRYAIMAGGSGLYIDAVCKGMDALPDPDLVLRRQLKEEYESLGLSHIQQRLVMLDPEYYNIVDTRNPSRILRALEVCLLTGKPFSSFRKQQSKPRSFAVLKYGLEIPRDVLNRRINDRVDEMMTAGLLDEVSSLLPFRHLNALNTVGYRELFAYLDGLCSLEQAVEKIKVNTRRYAKRQMTWFKKDTEIQWIGDWDEITLKH